MTEIVEMYRCPVHGWMEHEGMDAWPGANPQIPRMCEIALDQEDTCGMDLEGPYKVKLEVQDGG